MSIAHWVIGSQAPGVSQLSLHRPLRSDLQFVILEVKGKGKGPNPRKGNHTMNMYEHMNLEQLEAHVGMAAQGIDAAIENGEDVQQARDYHAAALHAYRVRSN